MIELLPQGLGNAIGQTTDTAGWLVRPLQATPLQQHMPNQLRIAGQGCLARRLEAFRLHLMHWNRGRFALLAPRTS